MKRIYLFLLLIISLTACTVTEQPEFKDIASIKVKETNAKEVIVEANARFLNKNSVGGTLQAKGIQVFIDDVAVAEVNSDTFKVPAKDEFTIPLKVKIPYSKVFKDNKNNVLSNVLNILTNKEINLRYKGNITYKLSAFSYNYPLDYTQKVALTN